jgi:hypothetical protein
MITWMAPHPSAIPIGFNTGIPRVGFCHTAPAPAYTVPVAGTGTYRPAKFAVLYETRGTSGTRGFVIFKLPCNLAKAAGTSIDVRRACREVLGQWVPYLGWVTYRGRRILPPPFSPPSSSTRVLQTEHLIGSVVGERGGGGRGGVGDDDVAVIRVA